ncbi:MAG: ribosome recycling factor [Candidatus Wallbacteria bacterium]|nr:ribosome recycling factor [Candidatus Wallbacteria bacterium]
MESLFKETREKMDKAIGLLKDEMGKIRTGRANPAILDDLRVDYYGTLTPIRQLATISVPEPRVLLIQPWDKSALDPIERCIKKSDLGLPPNSDGKLIRLNIPQLTQERRQEFVKMAHKRCEEGRIAVRRIRQDANDLIKKREKAHEVPEDLAKRGHDQVQQITDEYIKKVDEVMHHKEKDILEV